jgi:phosphatidylglycerophosphatase A
VPLAPGTAGALLGVPIAWGAAQSPSLVFTALGIVALCALGIPLCTRAALALGARKDPREIVFDEIASVPVTFFAIPLAAELLPALLVLGAGFVLHRVFDIVKPWPTRSLERLPAGLGIMADDWMAGVYSNLALRGLLLLAPALAAG